MNTGILIVGCNHRSAPVELRERVSFTQEACAQALRELRRRFPECQAVLISTCNRMELYLAAPTGGLPRAEDAIEFIAGFHGLPVDDLAKTFYAYKDREAVGHLFDVACSLDSMVLGETQILGQVKQCLELARSNGAVGGWLDGLFQQAFATAKEVHTQTGIAGGRVSVGSTAVDLARQVFSHFDDKIVMMVGAGEIGELTLTHLLETGPKRLWVTNRTDTRAVALVEKIAVRQAVPVEAVPFAQWIDHLAEADIAIASTSAGEPILTAEQFAPLPARRRYRPLLIIDLAVPRNVEPGVAEAEGVFLYNIDDLQAVVEMTLAQRRQAVGDCRRIIDARIGEFLDRRQRQDLGSLITALQDRFHTVADSELQRILPKLGSLSQADRQLIEQMLHRIVQKLLHEPISRLNNETVNGATQTHAAMLRAMFNLTGREPEK